MNKQINQLETREHRRTQDIGEDGREGDENRVIKERECMVFTHFQTAWTRLRSVSKLAM